MCGFVGAGLYIRVVDLGHMIRSGPIFSVSNGGDDDDGMNTADIT
jgi:hypothetical protein